MCALWSHFDAILRERYIKFNVNDTLRAHVSLIVYYFTIQWSNTIKRRMLRTDAFCAQPIIDNRSVLPANPAQRNRSTIEIRERNYEM